MSMDQNVPQEALRLADRLVAARCFVGRQAEMALFTSVLGAEIPPFAVLHLHGPGGIGKTSLLQQFAGVAAAMLLADVTPVRTLLLSAVLGAIIGQSARPLDTVA